MANGIGPHRPGDPRGLLVFDWLSDEYQRAEDGTAWADYENRPSWHSGVTRERAATATERLLLESLGYTPLPATLTTVVTWLSNGVRNRSWPQLEGQTP